jgi:hypothetical protein
LDVAQGRLFAEARLHYFPLSSGMRERWRLPVAVGIGW